MEQKFNCKEPNCTQEVIYKPQKVFGFFTEVQPDVTITVYLICAKGHRHPYEVRSDGE